MYCYEYPRPALTADVVVLREGIARLEVLLIKRASDPFKGRWALPGGFVDENEPLEAAAARELREETSLSLSNLEQIGAFGKPGRDPRGHTVAIAFLGIVHGECSVVPADDAEDAAWHSAKRPPPLAFDHREILRAALDRFDRAGKANRHRRR
jgi:8-oxo-dGTP diphosphatase